MSGKKNDDDKPIPPSRDLASRIYVQLATNAVQLSDGAVKMTASPENLTKLAYKLADAFYETEDALEKAKAPKTDYKLSADTVGEWMK